MPERPPRKWFYHAVKRISEERPEATDPYAVAGWLWYHGMKRATKKRILQAERGVKTHDPDFESWLNKLLGYGLKQTRRVAGRFAEALQVKPSVRRFVKTEARELKRAFLDPKELKVRKGLINKPRVLDFRDFKASGLIRVLQREDAKNREVMDYFPEFALYPRKATMIESSLKDAGLTQEARGKWVLRTNKFNIFVYI
jgi:hypothetical protein